MSTPLARSVHNTWRWQQVSKIVRLRDPICKRCGEARSTTAHHWPLTIEQLVARGLDPFDPQHSIGACRPCHGRDDGERAHQTARKASNRFLGTVMGRRTPDGG